MVSYRPSRRCFTLAVAAALATGRGAHAAPTNDAAQDLAFRDEVVALLRSKYPNVAIVLADDPGQVVIGRFTLNLVNLRLSVEGVEGALRRSKILDVVGRYAAAGPPTVGPAESFASASRRLLLQIVPIEYLEQAPDLVSRRLSTRLHVAYALDEADRYQLVTRPIFDAWGVERAEVERIASDNLERASAGVLVRISPTGGRGHFATVADETGYAAARLLLPVVMDQVRKGLETSAMVVAVPTRDVLIAWDPKSDARALLARTVTQIMWAGPYGRSAELFSWSPDGLRPLSPTELAGHGR